VSLDLILAVIFLLCFIYGTLRGFLLQAVALAALLVGLCASWLATSITGVLFTSGAPYASFLNAVLGILVFVLSYGVILRRGKKLIRARALAFSKGFADRTMGGIFSLVKGLVVVLLVIWYLDCIQAAFREAHPRAGEIWDESLGIRWARRYNPIAGLTPMLRIKGFLAAVRYPEARSRLQGQAAYARMMAHPRYRALRDNDEIAEAMIQGHWITVLRDERLRALAADRAFWRDFSSVKWEVALEKTEMPVEVHRPALTPVPPHSPAPAETRAGNHLGPEPPTISRVILKTGAALQGTIAKEDADGITLDMIVEGGVITMSVARDEIERIEGPIPPALKDAGAGKS
jgi:uncharacterized membrane protein required for colicin V production